MIRKNKQPLHDVIPNSMSATLLQICSIKKVVLIFAFSSQEGPAPMESIASIIIEFPLLINANSLINPRISSAEPGSVHTVKT